tara:strand:+ start:1617 stop:2045 length:429 start_codon:yes stop_codon:yes gene_type:complete
MNNCWIDIAPTLRGFQSVDISIGVKSQSFEALDMQRAKEAAKIYIVNEIRNYVKHRKHIIYHHNGRLTAGIEKSLNSLSYGFNGSTMKWKLEDMPRIIKNYTPHLLNIMPGPNSKFYKSQSQLVFDLIAWANDELKNNQNAA